LKNRFAEALFALPPCAKMGYSFAALTLGSIVRSRIIRTLNPAAEQPSQWSAY